MSGHAGVIVEDLVVEYTTGPEAVRPIDGLHFEVAAGHLSLLLGASGSGKTTVLSALAGILTPTSGRIRVNGKVVTELTPAELRAYRRETVGIVFQGFNLIASMTAAENVAAPLWASGIGRAAAARRAKELLDELGLADRLRHRPAELSGGQQQRVAIARALAHNPPLLLADEPTAHLDYTQAERVLRILRDLANHGRTILVSTHDTRLMPVADAAVQLQREPAAEDEPEAVVRARPGEVIFREGEAASSVFVVLRGQVVLERKMADGSTDVLATCGPGEYFGELGPLLGFPRAATARAVVTSRLRRMGVRTFRRHVQAGDASPVLGALGRGTQ